MRQLISICIITLGLLLVFSVVNSFKLSAQERVVILQGRLYDLETNQKLAYAHVVNLRKGQATVTDTSGYFRIPVMLGDTLRISSIGYANYYTGVDATLLDENKIFDLYMVKRTYEISTVNIYNLRWREFKHEFLNARAPTTPEKERLDAWIHTLFPPHELELLALSLRAGNIPLNFRSKADKSRQKLEKIEAEDAKNAVYKRRYNDSLVTRVTGLEGAELQQFMDYARIDKSFIAHSNDYDLIMRIKMLYRSYQQHQNN